MHSRLTTANGTLLSSRQRKSDPFRCRELKSVPLAVVKRECIGYESFVNAEGEGSCGIETATQQHDGSFHRRFVTELVPPGNPARTVRPIPPRAENSAVTAASCGEHAFRKSSRI